MMNQYRGFTDDERAKSLDLRNERRHNKVIECVTYWDTGKNVKEIAKLMGCSLVSVYRYLNDFRSGQKYDRKAKPQS